MMQINLRGNSLTLKIFLSLMAFKCAKFFQIHFKVRE